VRHPYATPVSFDGARRAGAASLARAPTELAPAGPRRDLRPLPRRRTPGPGGGPIPARPPGGGVRAIPRAPSRGGWACRLLGHAPQGPGGGAGTRRGAPPLARALPRAPRPTQDCVLGRRGTASMNPLVARATAMPRPAKLARQNEPGTTRQAFCAG